MHVPNFVLLSQNAQLLLLFMLCRLTIDSKVKLQIFDIFSPLFRIGIKTVNEPWRAVIFVAKI